MNLVFVSIIIEFLFNSLYKRMQEIIYMRKVLIKALLAKLCMYFSTYKLHAVHPRLSEPRLSEPPFIQTHKACKFS